MVVCNLRMRREALLERVAGTTSGEVSQIVFFHAFEERKLTREAVFESMGRFDSSQVWPRLVLASQKTCSTSIPAARSTPRICTTFADIPRSRATNVQLVNCIDFRGE